MYMLFRFELKKYRVSYAFMFLWSCFFLCHGCTFHYGNGFIDSSPSRVVFHESHDDNIVLSGMGESMYEYVYIKELDLWFAKYELSIRQASDIDPYKSYTSTSLSAQYGYSVDWPVMNVSAKEALVICDGMNRIYGKSIPTGYIFRLPTTEEWSCVAKAGGENDFSWGDTWPPSKMADGVYPNLLGEDKVDYNPRGYAIYYGFNGADLEDEKIAGYYDGYPGPAPVMKSGENKWGVCGIAGNVAEWCWDGKLGEYVLKDGWYRVHYRDACFISYEKRFPHKPHPMFPFMEDKKSHIGSGVRIVIGKTNK